MDAARAGGKRRDSVEVPVLCSLRVSSWLDLGGSACEDEPGLALLSPLSSSRSSRPATPLLLVHLVLERLPDSALVYRAVTLPLEPLLSLSRPAFRAGSSRDAHCGSGRSCLAAGAAAMMCTLRAWP